MFIVFLFSFMYYQNNLCVRETDECKTCIMSFTISTTEISLLMEKA